MTTDELLSYNLKNNLPVVDYYDPRFAAADNAFLARYTRDPYVLYELGERARQGIKGVRKDLQKACDCYRQVLYYQRNIAAMFWAGYLSVYFLPGKQVDGLKFLTTAYSLGSGEAARILGILYLERPDVLKTDYEKAYQYLRFAKEKGVGSVDSYLGRAAYMAALIYRSKGDPQHMETALFQAVKLRYAPAFGELLKADRLLIRYNLNSGLPYVREYVDTYDKSEVYTVIAAAGTDPAAMFEIASRYRMGGQGAPQDMKAALQYYKRVLLYQRHAGALYWLGRLTEDRDEDEAVQLLAMEYFKAAYSLGSTRAAMSIGVRYEIGDLRGYPKDLNRALQFYMYAKNNGHEYADASIGGVYEQLGNYDEAVRYYKLGVEQEDPYAMFDLATFYLNHDREAEGIRLMQQAAEYGSEEAKRVMEQYDDEIPPAPEEIIAEYDRIWKNLSENGGIARAAEVIRDGRELYPEDPDILIRYLKTGNVHAYGLFLTDKKDDAYVTFTNLNLLMMQFRKTVPARLAEQLETESSFCCTHLASLALERNEDAVAEQLLRSADRNRQPYSGVVKLHYLLKKGAEAEDRHEPLSASFYEQARAETETLRRTVEDAKGWNTPIDRYLGYCMLELFYRGSGYEPYIHQDEAYARYCREMADSILSSQNGNAHQQMRAVINADGSISWVG